MGITVQQVLFIKNNQFISNFSDNIRIDFIPMLASLCLVKQHNWKKPTHCNNTWVYNFKNILQQEKAQLKATII